MPAAEEIGLSAGRRAARDLLLGKQDPNAMNPDEPKRTPVHAPHGELEQSLIHQFVRARGYDPDRLQELPPDLRETLLKEASVYASSKLSEVEARSHFLHEIHDGGE